MSEQIIKFLANPMATASALIIVCGIWEAIPFALKWLRKDRVHHGSSNTLEHDLQTAYPETRAEGEIGHLAGRYKVRRARR